MNVPTFEQWFATSPSERRLRLFTVACARLPAVWEMLVDEWSRASVEVAERCADQGDGSRGRIAEYAPVELGVSWFGRDIAIISELTIGNNPTFQTRLSQWLANTTACPASTILACLAGPCVQGCGRCYGNGQLVRFRGHQYSTCPICSGSGIVQAPLPTLCGLCNDTCHECETIRHWNDSTIVRIARTIYDNRQWEDMPVLADALEDSGVEDAAILEHCRSGEYHARGCFVTDLILGL